jgi:hypothetical protein
MTKFTEKQRQYMVAVCDILGFSAHLQKNPVGDVVNQSLGWLRRSLYFALHKKQFPQEIPNKAEFLGNECWRCLVFRYVFSLYALR